LKPPSIGGLRGKVVSFYIVPLDPILKGGACGVLAGQEPTPEAGERNTAMTTRYLREMRN
jgi:hypothetical protein